MASQQKVSPVSTSSPGPKEQTLPTPRSTASTSPRASQFRFECKEGSIYTSSPVVKAEVKDSELGEENGKQFTTYVLTVENQAGVNWKVYRRYNEFDAVYQLLKDKVPQLSPQNSKPYRFPNKSKFNTNAEFTIKRRIEGFDELVKTVVSNHNIPQEFSAFIEPTDDDLRAFKFEPASSVPLIAAPKRKMLHKPQQQPKIDHGVCAAFGLPLALFVSLLYIAAMTLATIYLQKEKSWGITSTLCILTGFWVFFLPCRAILHGYEQTVCPKCCSVKCRCKCC